MKIFDQLKPENVTISLDGRGYMVGIGKRKVELPRFILDLFLTSSFVQSVLMLRKYQKLVKSGKGGEDVKEKRAYYEALVDKYIDYIS